MLYAGLRQSLSNDQFNEKFKTSYYRTICACPPFSRQFSDFQRISFSSVNLVKMGYNETLRNDPIQKGYPPQNGYPSQSGYTSQPQMQPVPDSGERRGLPMTAFQQQPQAFKQGSFQNHFCSCFDDCGTCCLGCWCPCILYGQTRARLQNPYLPREQLPGCSGSCCGFAAVLLFCAPFQCIFGWLQRGDIRERYGIEGDACVDCLAHSFCDCCVCFYWTSELMV